MFVSAIDSHQIENLEEVVLKAQICIISTKKQLEKALTYLSLQPVLGFDTETRPRFSPGKSYLPAILQLATQEISYLIHLKKVGLPQSLADLLANPEILKVGVAVRDDIIGLQRIAPFTPGGFVDLQTMAEEYGITDKSIRKLSAIVLGCRVSKAQQTTNWESYPLTEAQQQYAATDAYVGYKIYQRLMDNPQEKKTTKERIYEEIIQQGAALIDGEDNLIANMANATAIIKEHFNFWWVGFYLVNKESNQLILGPFQGPLACTRIPFGRGVCGTAWQKAQTIIVPDVDQFPGHIACSSRSKSEIVVPVYNNNKEIVGVLDIDSEKLASFNKLDKMYLEEFVGLFKKFF